MDRYGHRPIHVMRVVLSQRHKCDLASWVVDYNAPPDINGFTELLQEEYYGALNEKQLQYVQNIDRSGKHLLGLITDFLDVSKIDSGVIERDSNVCVPITGSGLKEPLKK